MVLKMEQKPKLVYLLIILWIIVGVLFLGIFISQIMSHLDYLESVRSYPVPMDKFMAQINFSYISYEVLYLIIIIFAFILAYGAYFNKKWCWLIGIMYTSALTFNVYMAIVMIGTFIIIGSFASMPNFQIIALISMIFFVPCLQFILTKPEVKIYFEKSQTPSQYPVYRNY